MNFIDVEFENPFSGKIVTSIYYHERINWLNKNYFNGKILPLLDEIEEIQRLWIPQRGDHYIDLKGGNPTMGMHEYESLDIVRFFPNKYDLRNKNRDLPILSSDRLEAILTKN